MHLVHDTTVKNAKLWLFLLLVIISATAQGLEFDMTHWRDMGDDVYQATLRRIQPGDTLKYTLRGTLNIFNIEGRLKKAPGAEDSFSENFLLDNQRVLQLPSSIMLAHTLVNFMEGHDAFEKAGINVVKVYPESDPENFIIKEYVPHISFRALVYLLVDNNSGFVSYELHRRVSQAEKEAMKVETIAFIQSLAAITEAHDFGIQQLIYSLKSNKPMVLDFLGVPKFFDPSSSEPQHNLLETWTDFETAKQYGEDMEGMHHISLKAFKVISSIYEQQRVNLATAFRCSVDLNLAAPKPGPVQHPIGPKGT